MSNFFINDKMILTAVISLVSLASQAQVAITSPKANSVLPDVIQFSGSCTGTTSVSLRNGTLSTSALCSNSKWLRAIEKRHLVADSNNVIKVSAVQGNSRVNVNYLSKPTTNDLESNKFKSCSGTNLGLTTATQQSNILFGSDSAQKFDLYLPSGNGPFPLVVLVHGGGFISGDKSEYKNTAVNFTKKGVAAISINYRFANAATSSSILANQAEGSLRSIKDGQRALQFIRCHSHELKIDPNNIVLFGSSAGASLSLWVGLQNDLAITNSPDPIDRMSTRVKGIVANSTQSSLDGLYFETELFKTYSNFSTDLLSSRAPRLYHIVKYDRKSFIENPAIVSYRKAVHFIDFMSVDDPEIWVSNSEQDLDPSDKNNPDYGGIHHPNHVLALKAQGDRIGIKGNYSTPNVPQNNLPITESSFNFALRKLKESQ